MPRRTAGADVGRRREDPVTSTIAPTGPPSVPQPGPPEVSAPGAAPAPRRARRDTMRLPAELALVALTVATALGFGRLFTDNSYQGPVLLFAVASHGLATVLRRRRVPVLLAAPISAIALVAVGSWVFYAATTRLWLPTGETLEALRVDLSEALERFRAEQAPTEAVTGFVAVSAAVFWVVAFIADWAAWRLKAPFEATIPTGALFVFVSVLARGRSSAFATVLFFLAITTFLLLQRVSRQEASPAWVRADGTRGARALAGGGFAILVVALVAGAVVGPLLPGARSEPVIDLRGMGNDSGLRVTVSPLVDIRQRLVNQRDTPVFTVRTPTRAYWRLTALDEFDGRVWRSSKKFEKVDGNDLSSIRPAGGDRVLVEQEYEVSGLAQIWLPAAYEPTDVRVNGRDVRWEQETSTLIVDKETSDGLRYTVTSDVGRYTPEELDTAVQPAPADVRARFLDLPRGLSPQVSALAEAIVNDAGATTPYRQALALQDYFRNNYTYSTEITGGQDIDRIEEFLTSDLRQGYCEQFAGAFAAMARTLGLPARVAVGFTPGDPDATDPSSYQVRGRHAHAWPEVYLAGYGWVLFEPTPGRGAPGATSYTNVEERQDSDVAPGGVLETTTTTAVDPTATTDTVPELPTDIDPATLDEFGEGGTSSTTSEDGVRGTTGRLGMVLIGLVVAYLLAMVVGHQVLRARRRRAATTNARRVESAWVDAVDAVSLVGIRLTPSDTPAEFAARAGSRAKCRDELDELAALATAARYAGGDLDEATARRAEGLAAEVITAVKGTTNAFARTLADIDPRTLLATGRTMWRAHTEDRRARRARAAAAPQEPTTIVARPGDAPPARSRRPLSGAGRSRD